MLRIALLALALLASCTSTRLRIDSEPMRADEETVGMTKGVASGFMLLSVFPLGQNTRFERAYQNAVEASRADRLVNITVWESWYWCGVGNLYVFQIEGQAVKKKRAP